MFGIVLTIANYFHDLAVAVLMVSVLTTYYLGQYFDRQGTNPDVPANLFSKLLRVSWYALAYIVIGGALRAWFFMDFEWNPAVGKGQVAALIVKHIILVTITVVGIISHLKYYRKYGQQKT